MRGLLAFIAFFGLTLSAWAASNTYDVYVLACDDGTDCLRVADIGVDQEGPTADYSGPGISLRIDTLTIGAESAIVRLTLNLTPRALAFASMGTRREAASARFSFQAEPCTIRRNQFGFLGTFSGGNKIYQVWGRLMAKPSAAEVVASR
ncbi:MAG: hypothetical protein HZC22_15020 [Rhodocyclales bacterium]|nr:hypothetical protein [Rhodocyclales bacterium]